MNWSKWILVEDILSQVLLTLLAIILAIIDLIILLKVLICGGWFLWCELLCKVSIYTLKSDQWITIWWEKFELQCLLLDTCKNGDFEYQYIRTHSEEKTSKISNITFPILQLPHQNVLPKLPTWVSWNLLFLIKPSDMLQDVSF